MHSIFPMSVICVAWWWSWTRELRSVSIPCRVSWRIPFGFLGFLYFPQILMNRFIMLLQNRSLPVQMEHSIAKR